MGAEYTLENWFRYRNPLRKVYSVTWKSSNTSIAKVSKRGVVTAVKNGKATITATVAEHPEMTATPVR
ncbi:MAG: Ig-like domain-containing protein [Blautia wexlerae]